MSQIQEPDWKILRQLSPIALDRLCEGILSEIEQINSDSTKSSHQKYLDIYEVVQRQNKEIALIFDDLRRSNAMIPIIAMKTRSLLTDEELSGFSQEIQNVIALYPEKDSA